MILSSNYILIKIITIIISFGCFFAFGQKRVRDSTAIESFKDKFIVKINLDSKTDSYNADGFGGGPDINLDSNYGSSLFLSLEFQIIGLSLGFSPSFLPGNSDEELRGESSFIDIEPRLAFQKWLIELRYSRITGYYVENTEDFIPDWEENVDPYILIPDLSNTTYGITISHIFNPNFSYKNLFYQTERQRKSAGSFVPTFQYSYNKFTFDLEDIPDDIKFKGDNSDLSLGIGYYYTWVIGDKWFVAPNVSPSAGVRFSKSTITLDGTTTEENITFFKTVLESGLQLGYASERVIFGIAFNYDIYGYEGEEGRFINNDKTYGLLYFGYRFNSPRFLAKSYDKFAKTKFAKKMKL